MSFIGDATGNNVVPAESGGMAFFGDASEYRSHFGDMRINLAVRGPGDFAASLAWLRLPNVCFYRAVEVLPRVAYVALPPGKAFITFPAVVEPAPIWNGIQLRLGDIVFHGDGERFHQLSFGPTQWAAISLSTSYLSRQSELLLGRRLKSPQAGQIVRPSKAVARQLRDVHTRACQLTYENPWRIAHPQIAKAIEGDIMRPLLASISSDRTVDFTPGPRSHGLIVSNLSEIVSSHDSHRLSSRELCELLGTSERTLRTSCANILKMSPNEYERLWRLNRARQRLITSTDETIADIARRSGFSEPGRFAAQYREQFGESPSAARNRSERHFATLAEFA